MTTGYTIPARGDLDVLFKARTSAAAANVNFLSNGGVDLSQRFEPRGSSTAIANTGFQSAGVDLAQIFMSINADPLSMTAGNFLEAALGRTNLGFATSGLITGSSGIGSVSTNVVGANTLAGLWWNDDDNLNIALNNAGGAPADADASWSSMSVFGFFQGGSANETRSATRSARTSTSVSGTRRIWVFNPGIMAFADGNVYAVTFYRA
ncbi:MAG TPA: hypothetical protein VFB63_19475 [Bryobacteraceae bacterium]|nr:hypothetical protein [Bryobacteraceae bacterium]